ncbi:UNVERIFIED_CONTAM: hypothetical protein PYX00_006215 [Menopon gallinae]
MDVNEYRVLAVQSHVVSGYVGNRSATFPLQLLGFEVDVINSTHLSNHTGYGYWKGQILSKSELEEIIDGIKHNGLDNYTHVLSGYVRDSGFLQSLGEYIKNLKRANQSLCFVCSPVMGDNKKMYVPKELLPIYKETIVPLANIVTGNQFEFELLSDRTINNMKDALKAIEAVHDLGVEIAVITSTDFGGENKLISIASRRQGKEREVLKIEVPRLPTSFTGTGDLFAGIFLGWWTKTKNLQETFENVTATMFAVLKRTFQSARQKCGVDNLTVGSLELRLVQSKSDIERPTCTFTAEHVEV